MNVGDRVRSNKTGYVGTIRRLSHNRYSQEAALVGWDLAAETWATLTSLTLVEKAEFAFAFDGQTGSFKEQKDSGTGRQPFEVGDRVEYAESESTGDVVEVRSSHTRVKWDGHSTPLWVDNKFLVKSKKPKPEPEKAPPKPDVEPVPFPGSTCRCCKQAGFASVQLTMGDLNRTYCAGCASLLRDFLEKVW